MHLTGIAPMLEVNDLQETIRFYTETLGFDLTGTWPDDGPGAWAVLQAGQVQLMFICRDAPTSTLPTLTGQLYCYPENVDTLWNHLKDRVEIAWPLGDMPYGMREFAIRDCNGYLLTFGQDLES